MACDTTRSNVSEFIPMFDWYDNRCETALRSVYRNDISNRQKLVHIARDLNDSKTYWDLLTKCEEAYEAVKGDGQKEAEVLLAFAARMYAAGSLHGFSIVEDPAV